MEIGTEELCGAALLRCALLRCCVAASDCPKADREVLALYKLKYPFVIRTVEAGRPMNADGRYLGQAHYGFNVTAAEVRQG